ncbi:hypothetical protein KUV89_06885 [Marinobacter hydrocarbonoclasticus]|nr:hypothetical protein [Marinobacter nauticus]
MPATAFYPCPSPEAAMPPGLAGSVLRFCQDRLLIASLQGRWYLCVDQRSHAWRYVLGSLAELLMLDLRYDVQFDAGLAEHRYLCAELKDGTELKALIRALTQHDHGIGHK